MSEPKFTLLPPFLYRRDAQGLINMQLTDVSMAQVHQSKFSWIPTQAMIDGANQVRARQNLQPLNVRQVVLDATVRVEAQVRAFEQLNMLTQNELKANNVDTMREYVMLIMSEGRDKDSPSQVSEELDYALPNGLDVKEVYAYVEEKLGPYGLKPNASKTVSLASQLAPLDTTTLPSIEGEIASLDDVSPQAGVTYVRAKAKTKQGANTNEATSVGDGNGNEDEIF